jgi:transitional endoplasmic reticulum ATPase
MAGRTRVSATREICKYTLPPIVELWLLRLLVPLGGHQEFIKSHGFRDELLARVVGLADWIDSDDFDVKKVVADLRRIHAAAERKYRNARVPECLAENISRLATLVGLSDADCRVLEVAVFAQTERLLNDGGDWLGQLSSQKLSHVIAVLLDVPACDVHTALSPQGLLAKSGLLSVDRDGTGPFCRKFNLLSSTFADIILTTDADPITLLRDTVRLGSPAHLSVSDFSHITKSLAVLQPYLKHSLDSGRKGVNIYLHGGPGTGKSQLAKVLAKELECELFEVASEDSDGDPIKGTGRLRAFRAGQSFFSSRRAMILFDEAEDVFNDGDGLFGRKSTAQTRKAWINRMLEENAVPTIWLSNAIRGVDPAFVRRFDMVFELAVPPKKQRASIIRKACAGILDEASVDRIAEAETLAPAVVTKAASVVSAITDKLEAGTAAECLEMLIGNTLLAQGHRGARKSDPARLPEVYDPAFIHADSDLTQIPAGLRHSKSGRLCLYGPPGTGKTAFARWLAVQLDAPLVVKRASDLMSMYVGENEKNIAHAFNQAEQDGALLLIDEVDSFLQDRRGSRNGWEVSLVNEMLTQMESFAGVFIASTNLMDGIDQAALRRFDLKVKFDYLQPAQACEMFQRYCASLNMPDPAQEVIQRLSRLSKLTPGDFAAVARQHMFRPVATAQDIATALEAECALKQAPTCAMGFV